MLNGRNVADHIRPKGPKLVAIIYEAETDLLANMPFPREHRTILHNAFPIERLNGVIKRRTEAVGIFPRDDKIIRFAGAILLEQNDEWALQCAHYMALETMNQMSVKPLVSLPAVAS